MNKLLLRLLKKYLDISVQKKIPKSLQSFMAACNTALDDLDIQRARAQHSLQLVSEELLEKNEEIKQNKEEIEKLLYNILPEPIIERVLNKEKTIADFIPDANVMFADIANFTRVSSKIGGEKTVKFLNNLFIIFDKISKKHKIRKIKTIGDCYMAGNNIVNLDKNSTDHLIEASREMINAFSKQDELFGVNSKLRVGINSGPVIAGVIGQSIFSYDLWGNTVNLASRMESSGLGNTIQITKKTYDLLSKENKQLFKPRGYIDIKGKGKVYTYIERINCK
jgi:adenylate cyclase